MRADEVDRDAWRVTIRGEGVELRGTVAGADRVEELAQLLHDTDLMVLASIADEVGDDPPDDLTYDTWVLLANGAYWDQTDLLRRAEWVAARDRWRDRWQSEAQR